MALRLILAAAHGRVAVAGGGPYDYIVAGAGTAGLVVANRLSADPYTSVLVIEPGGDEHANPNVTSPLAFTRPLFAVWTRPMNGRAPSLTRIHKTTPQPHLANRSLEYHQGKAIGGTSTINGMTYLRGDAAEPDAWAALGNPGWDWKSMYPYYLRSEAFSPPTEAQTAAGASWIPRYHGNSGPLRTSYPYEMLNGTLFDRMRTTWEALGQGWNRDPNGGDVRGFAAWPMTVDRDADVREDAARAYFWDVAGRPNLDIVQGVVKRVVWEDDGCGTSQGQMDENGDATVVARGVEYETPDGNMVTVVAKKEVILSAGAIRTPLILEQSGVGNPERNVNVNQYSILSSFGIPTIINLTGVGENFQEQPNIVLVYNGTTPDDLDTGSIAPYATFLTAGDLFGEANLPALASRNLDSIPAWSTQIAAANGDRISAKALEHVLRVQHDLIFAKNATVTEIISFARPGQFGSAWWPLLPFSRGSVHLGRRSRDPVINPQYLLADFDKTIAVAAGRAAQKFWRTAPMSELVGANTVPGPEALPNYNATDAQWEAHLANTATPNHHGLGTAAMMSRDLGGVVDPELRVYGNKNVRVVDASVIPLQISGHLTVTLYALAERASEIIMSQGTTN
ncbi:uncharacterized protein PG986_014142 [Apiospora aurea]|uniref:Glucose-methanol-choline oxidoreductase N-terminal domain-containing protein n=1 Tax=Apiospora aurea TaxID=335848 RepID=A0ABR1PS52_9PEZI